MAFKRRRNIETERYVARKQAAAMGGIDADELVKLIDAKGGDYYRAELNPTPGAREAYDNLGMTQSNSPMIAVQQDLLDDMRKYYGINSSVPSATDPVYRYDSHMGERVPNIPTPAVTPATAQKTQSTMPLQSKVEDTPKAEEVIHQEAAQKLKDDYVNEILGYDLDERINEISKPKGILLDDPLADTMLWGSAALLAGGGIGRVTAPKEDEVIEAPEGLMVRPAPGYVVSY
jgi:hypothetical protein